MKIRYLILLASTFIVGCSQVTEASSSLNSTKMAPQHLLASTGTNLDVQTKKVEMVFCLDATGSMGGLIGTAKEKIWAIVSEVVQDTVATDVKLGMVFYRDKTDDFVTKRIKLTDDIDAVYDELLSMSAFGGGDSPESVNQGLYEAITMNDWSSSQDVYKTIFVVGDCPPHMDYNEVRYTESCKMAQEKGIIINTIKLGSSCRDAISHFKAMASCSGGEFLQLSQNAKDVVISTPYDIKIKEVSREIDESKVYYGSKKEQSYNNSRKETSLKLYDKSSESSTSERAKYNTSKSGKKNWMGDKEMVSAFKNGELNLEELSEDELPVEYASKTKEEILMELENKVNERDKRVKELKELTEKRNVYIKTEKEKMGEKESFSKQVNEIVKAQRKK